MSRARRALGAAVRSAWAPGVILHLLLGIVQLPKRDLLGDEAFTATAVHRLAETLGQTSGTMAAYYVALTPWSWVSHGAVWLSLPSLLATTGAVAVLAVLVERQAGLVAGRWAGAIAGTTYVVVRYSTIARSYGLWMLFAALAWYFLDRAIADPADRRATFGFGAVTAVLPLLHGMAALGVVPLVLAIVIARPPRRSRTCLLTGCAAALVFDTVLFALGAHRIGHEGPVSWQTLRWMVVGVPFPALRPALVLLGLAAVGVVVLRRAGEPPPSDLPIDRFRRWALPLWAALPPVLLVGLSVVRPSMASRFVIPSALAVAGLLAIAVTARPLPRLAALALPAATVGVLLVGQASMQTPNHQWRESAALVAHHARAGDGLVFAPSSVRLPFESAISHPAARAMPPIINPGGDLGTFDRFGTRDDAAEVDVNAFPYRRVWVISHAIEDAQGRAPALLRSLREVDGFRPTRTWQVGEVSIWLLERPPRPPS